MVKLRRIFESNLYLESKKDLDDLKAFLGDELFDDYMKIRDRISKDQNEFKDFSKLKKMDKKDIQDFVSSFQSKSDKKRSDKTEGAEKLYEDDEGVVYRITTYPAAQLYGKGTKWCIAGRYAGHEEQGQDFFNDYIDDKHLDGGYYFYINKKDPNEKYCVLQTKGRRISSIWDAGDTDRGTSMVQARVVLPKVDQVNLKSPNKKDLLYIYIANDDVEEIKDLLQQKINLNSSTFNPPILEEAVNSGNKEVVELLLKHGANPNIENKNGDTPLFVASKSDDNKNDIVELLLKHGADPNVINNRFISPILLASNRGHTDIVELLLKHGADVDVYDLHGFTPLMMACVTGKYDTVKFLLENGAEVNVKNNNGETPLSLASRYKDIVSLLKKYGATE